MTGETGPSTITTLRPLEAVSSIALLDHESNQAPHREPFFVEHEDKQYDVHDVNGAEAYLTEVHGRDLPRIRGEFDATTGFHLAFAVQKEDRAAIYEDGNFENVAEHSFFLAVTCSWTAMNERPDLNAGNTTIIATHHDQIVEGYGGDTPIHDIEKLATKEAREAAGMTLFLRDVGDSPLGQLMLEYEEGRTPEARFVKGMDKVVAYQLSLATKAALHSERQEEFKDIVETALPKAVIDKTAFSKMKGVLKQLGRKWNDPEWGCKKFEGDPDEIVDRIANYVQDQGAEVTELPSFERAVAKAALEGNVEEAELRQFPDREQLRERNPLKTKIAATIGEKVVEMHAKRRGDDRPDPTPPGAPAAISLAAA